MHAASGCLPPDWESEDTPAQETQTHAHSAQRRRQNGSVTRDRPSGPSCPISLQVAHTHTRLILSPSLLPSMSSPVSPSACCYHETFQKKQSSRLLAIMHAMSSPAACKNRHVLPRFGGVRDWSCQHDLRTQTTRGFQGLVILQCQRKVLSLRILGVECVSWRILGVFWCGFWVTCWACMLGPSSDHVAASLSHHHQRIIRKGLRKLLSSRFFWSCLHEYAWKVYRFANLLLFIQ